MSVENLIFEMIRTCRLSLWWNKIFVLIEWLRGSPETCKLGLCSVMRARIHWPRLAIVRRHLHYACQMNVQCMNYIWQCHKTKYVRVMVNWIILFLNEIRYDRTCQICVLYFLSQKIIVWWPCLLKRLKWFDRIFPLSWVDLLS